MAEAGAGKIGQYQKCSFAIDGIGSFQGDEVCLFLMVLCF
jgi:hypothetical protein